MLLLDVRGLQGEFYEGTNAKTADLANLHANRCLVTVASPRKVSACWDMALPALRTDVNNPMPLISRTWQLSETRSRDLESKSRLGRL
jgi:hypothetical protein